MDITDKELLIECAEELVEQAATLSAWKSASLVDEVAHLETQDAYVSQVKRSQPLIDQMKSLGHAQSSEQEILDTLRKLLRTLTNPTL